LREIDILIYGENWFIGQKWHKKIMRIEDEKRYWNRTFLWM